MNWRRAPRPPIMTTAMITLMTTATTTTTIMATHTATAAPDTITRRDARRRNGRRRTAPANSRRAPAEPDLDKVEAAFIDGFIDARDPVSFLRLGHIPFEIVAADGARLNLLRVEIDALADVGSLTPHLGGGSFRYDPLPASLVSHRRRLRFVYFDGEKLRPLTFNDVRGA